jgi:hypothetical protein
MPIEQYQVLSAMTQDRDENGIPLSPTPPHPAQTGEEAEDA